MQPDVTLEVSLANPGDTPVWEDISAAFRSATIQRGKSSELDSVRAGTMTVVLSNADRTFDPEHSGSSLAPDWKPVRRIRLSASIESTEWGELTGTWGEYSSQSWGTFSGGPFPQFTGLIDTIRQEYAPPGEAVAVVECIDTMLEAVVPPSSAYAVEVGVDTPAHWWRFGEPDDTEQAADSVTGGYPLTTIGAPSFGEGSLAINDPDGSVTFPTSSDGLQGVFPAGTFPFGTAGSIEFLYKKTDAASTDPIMSFVTLGSVLYGFDSVANSDGDLDLYLVNSAGAAFPAISTGVNFDDLATHHIVVTWAAGSDVKIYIDGADRTGVTTTFTGTMVNTTDPWIAAINAVDYPPFITLGYGSVATIDELALYATALAPTRIAVHNAAARTAWRGDTSGERIERILDAIGWPTADRDIDTGQTVLQSVELGSSALDHLQEVVDAEQGLLFVTKDGKIRFRERHAGLNLESQVVFGDDASDPSELGYSDLSYNQSAAQIFNVIRRQREGGITQEVRDEASIAAYYERTDEVTGLIVGGNDPDAEMLDAANYRLAVASQPITRVDRLGINPQADEADLFPQVLGRELGEQITLRRRPQNVGSTIEQNLRIEGINLTVEKFNWRATWSLSPAEARTFLELDLASGPGLDDLILAY